MPTTPKINLEQNKTNKHNSNKVTSTIHPARLTVPPTSNKNSINNSDCSAQDSNMNSQANDGWITQTSKKNLSSSSSDMSTKTSPSKTVLP